MYDFCLRYLWWNFVRTEKDSDLTVAARVMIVMSQWKLVPSLHCSCKSAQVSLSFLS